MPFWSKRQPSVTDQTAEYVERTRRRVDAAAAIMARLEHMIRIGDPQRLKYVDCSELIRKLANEQREEVVSLPAMEPHKEFNHRLIDLEALIAEEADLQREAEEEASASQQRTQEILEAYGTAPSDSSNRFSGYRSARRD